MKGLPQLRRQARHLDNINRQVADVLEQMRAGAALHLEIRGFGPRWFLSNGKTVPTEAARTVACSPQVAGVGDTLPPGAGGQSQTFRFIDHHHWKRSPP